MCLTYSVDHRFHRSESSGWRPRDSRMRHDPSVLRYPEHMLASGLVLQLQKPLQLHFHRYSQTACRILQGKTAVPVNVPTTRLVSLRIIHRSQETKSGYQADAVANTPTEHAVNTRTDRLPWTPNSADHCQYSLGPAHTLLCLVVERECQVPGSA